MLIRQIEAYNRGFFAGACGYVDAAGDGEFSVALRTGVFDGEIGYVYAGCGIVDGSRAADEYDEIALKLKTVLSAFDGEAGAASAHSAQDAAQTCSPNATQIAGQTSPQATTAGKGEAR